MDPFISVISAPGLLCIGAILGYIKWRFNASRKAKKNVTLMNAAATPVRPDSLPAVQIEQQQAAQSYAAQAYNPAAFFTPTEEREDDVKVQGLLKDQHGSDGEVVQPEKDEGQLSKV